MKRYNKYLLGSDYDGTLTDMSGHIPKNNIDAILKFEEDGGIFCLATGRSYTMCKTAFKQMKIIAPVVLFNGAAIYYPDRETTEILNNLPNEAFDLAKEIHIKYPHLFMEIQSVDCHYIFGENTGREEFLRKNEVNIKRVPFNEMPKDGLHIIFFAPGWYFGQPESDESAEEAKIFAEISKRAKEVAESLHSLARTMEIIPRNVSKGRALRLLAKRFEREMLVCVGDGENDLPMLSEADIAFVPRNCQSIVAKQGYNKVCICAKGAVADVISKLR